MEINLKTATLDFGEWFGATRKGPTFYKVHLQLDSEKHLPSLIVTQREWTIYHHHHYHVLATVDFDDPPINVPTLFPVMALEMLPGLFKLNTTTVRERKERFKVSDFVL